MSTYAYESKQVNANQVQEISDLRQAFKELHDKFVNNQINKKDGRYSSLAKTALEEACMWAIKSITHAE